MNAQLRIRTLLAEEMERLQSRNPGFSLRAFARRLDLAPSNLSEILAGKRRISPKAAKRVLSVLGDRVAPKEAAGLISACRLRREVDEQSEVAGSGKSGPHRDEVDSREFVLLNMDQFHLISDWRCYAVLSLAETDDFQASPAWIARRLGITLDQARRALERLERLQMLERDESGKLVPTGLQYRTTEDISNLAIRRSHRRNLELAGESLERDPVEDRDFSMITMAIDPAKLPAAKEKIRKFRRELSAFLESGEKREVFRLSVQLFPLSRMRKSKPKSKEKRR